MIKLNNGVEMPAVGFGTYKTNERCVKSVVAAIEAGYRLIDTAEVYGNETDVGLAVSSCGIPRGEIFITTKVNYGDYERAEDIVAGSLKKLKTDYLDLVLLHWPFGNYYSGWKSLQKLYAQGVIRAIGVSNFNPDRLVDLALMSGTVPAVNQMETNLYCQRKEEREWELRYGVAHQAYTPLGRTSSQQLFSEPAVTELAEKYGRSPAQILLKHLVQQGISVIPKSSTPERIRENIDIEGFDLTAEEIGKLSLLDRKAPLFGFPEKPWKVEKMLSLIGRGPETVCR